MSNVCPRCGREIVGHPALSRRDNKTYICDGCGMAEAMEDMANAEYREGFAEYRGISIHTKAGKDKVTSRALLEVDNIAMVEGESLREAMRGIKKAIDNYLDEL